MSRENEGVIEVKSRKGATSRINSHVIVGFTLYHRYMVKRSAIRVLICSDS